MFAVSNFEDGVPPVCRITPLTQRSGLDASAVAENARHAIKDGGDKVVDLACMAGGSSHMSAVASVATGNPRRESRFYHAVLERFKGLWHVTIDVQASHKAVWPIAVKSPCIDVCSFDDGTKLCVGCIRTFDEIRAWRKMAEHRRLQAINDRVRRRPWLQRESSELSAEAITFGR